MSANPIDRRRSSRFRPQKQYAPAVIRPVRVSGLREALDPGSRYLPPFRPMGANSSATECTSSSAGTVIDVTGLNEIKNIDAYGDSVTVQAGVRIGDLARELAEHGLARRLVGVHAALRELPTVPVDPPGPEQPPVAVHEHDAHIGAIPVRIDHDRTPKIYWGQTATGA